jgi:hypothetical protein
LKANISLVWLREQLSRGDKANIPLDSEAGHTGLLGQDIAADALNDGLGWGLCGQLLGVVLVVDIVADTDELTTIVATGQEDDSDTQDLGGGDTLQIGGVGLKDELIHADRDWADKEGVEFLIVLGAIHNGLVRGKLDAVSGWNYEVAEPT